MKLRRKMISESGPGWAVVTYDGRVLPGRWADQETAETEGLSSVYLLSGDAVAEVPLQYKRFRLDRTLWQIAGDLRGPLRHAVFGTVERVYDGWFAVSAAGEGHACKTLKEGARWLADQWEAQ